MISIGDMPHDEQVSLTLAVMSILDGWGLSSAQQISVLNLPQGTPRRAMRKYRDNTPLPDAPGVMERLEHIVGITDALRTSYPHNPAMGNLWLQQRSKHFQGQIPLAIIVNEGLDGLVKIRMHLDCSYDWHTDTD